MKPLGLHKFKLVGRDDKKTTFQHPDGHEIHIAHNSLSKEIQTQLEELGKTIKQPKEETKESPKKLAEGTPEEPLKADDRVDFNWDVKAGDKNDLKETTSPQEDYTAVAGGPGQTTPATPLPVIAPQMPAVMNDASRGLAQTPSMSQQSDGVPATQDSQAMYQQGLNKTIAGINQQAAAQATLGKEQATALQGNIEAKNRAIADYQSNFNNLIEERNRFISDYDNQHINPELYWTGDAKTGMGGHSKILSAIGLILGGFNPTSRPNAAVELLKYQMDKNLEAQRDNLGKSKTLLEANMRQFGNVRDAMDMTRLMQNDMVESELKRAAANSSSPMAAAMAQQAIGKLRMEAAPIMQQFATRATINKLSASNDPKALEQAIEAMQQTNPEQAKQLRERFVPDIGLAQTAEGAKTVRETRTMIDSVKSDIAKLRAITAKSGKSLSLEDRAKADTIRKAMVGALRVPITGPGSMSEGERELLLELVPDPTSFFSLDSNTRARLDTLEDKMNNNLVNTATANGMKVPGYERQELVEGKDGRMYKKTMHNGKPGYIPVK